MTINDSVINHHPSLLNAPVKKWWQDLSFQLLSVLLLFKASVMIGIILFGGIELGPDEAQYWTWSRKLDWGYYSKPPGIAWQIWLGTQVFGATELGVRFLAVLISLAQGFAVYFLAKNSKLSSSAALGAGLLMAFSPIGLLGSLFAVTDGGFLLFWTLACCVVTHALSKGQAANPSLVGGMILCGALFKWPIYLFWIFFLLARGLYFPQQNLFKTIEGILLSLLGFLPSVIWNRSHDWATFRHVSATVQGGSVGQAAKGNPLEFIGSQLAIISPFIFIFFCVGLIVLFKQRKKEVNPSLVWCGILSGSLLTSFCIASFFQKIQGNWSLLVYPTAFVITSWYLSEIKTRGQQWLKLSLGVAVFLTAIILSFPFLQTLGWIAHAKNPLKHNLGWSALEQGLSDRGYNSHQHFLFSDKYQTTSLLSFYSPEKQQAYFFNLHGIRNNQFCYWPGFQEEQQGKTGYFVWVENSPHLQRDQEAKLAFYDKELKHYFGTVEKLEMIPLVWRDKEVVKGAWVFKCSEYKGHLPKCSNLY